jgi:hypothetical protein
MSHSTALNFMRVFEAFKFANIANLNLPQTALFMLSAPSVDHETREIGNRLIHAKEVAGHGHFGKWIEAEFGMSHHMAWSFMNAAKVFSNSDLNRNLNLPQTALFMLSAPSVAVGFCRHRFVSRAVNMSEIDVLAVWWRPGV